ncbi:CopG family transcriptional regulator [Listeria monocytogenes]|uniref:Antitoxin EndoAI n=2 Tax=Listeria monocytogenes TaxID=1639 RepID=A0A1S7FMH0_LISMN|nr:MULTISPECIES: CopG family ribbon-helix-helix protein [Listeria]EAE1680099.1 CopG family ribbon-helix-helix protein [Listeria monocytogenes LIS0071]EAE3704537.1 CopG family ribbon-helix-helix protein [Listeria monocytogenes serotype 1/2b]EAF3077037.1 CopG family ribbon-helix-helix protein [Listeria monocytogenes serotype 1/2a]EAG6251972.1 CopG family ribbon-helix-helix protein [Listeria monocytogenes CFSAN003806]EAG6261321.1 CopG family ribbon-helix-helix protein [Listeria monocytogenes CFSA
MLEKEKRMIISVELTQEMIQELDVVVEKEKMGRSEVIMEATQQFLQEKRARELRDEMERGYAEMATINFAIACECTHVEAEAEDRNISILGG